jgi:catechol 2,3-dioxygenase-like lactoylglutathione lyase family enzyme
MIEAKRIGHATLATTDLDRQIEYFHEVVGLTTVSRDRGAAYLATGVGQLAIVLHKGAGRGCARIAFEVSASINLKDAQRQLATLGITADLRSDPLPGIPQTLVFSDPKGTTLELFAESQFLDVPASARNDMGAFKLGHLAFATPDPAAMAAFYQRALGFRVSDWIGDFFVFLRCNADHHTVNFIRGDADCMHHIAFELKDAAHLHRSCDLLGRQRTPLIWGPVRHGPGHNLATYHRDPDDNITEFFAELDRMPDEERGYFEPRPWHEDRPQRPKVWDGAKPREGWGLPPTPDFLRQAKLGYTPRTPSGA